MCEQGVHVGLAGWQIDAGIQHDILGPEKGHLLAAIGHPVSKSAAVARHAGYGPNRRVERHQTRQP
jgi:hypothetical protein